MQDGRYRQSGNPAVPDAIIGSGSLLAVILIALLALRIAALVLNRTDLFFDEAQYWAWGQEPAFGYYSKPPLVAWLIAASTAACGDATWCVRLPAPLIHTASAAAIYVLAARLYGPFVGLLSGLAFATLPAVSLSSGIISTDVPLLLAWAVALWALVRLQEDTKHPAHRSWWPAVVLGVALGTGLNAKYAMIFFALCLAVWMATTPRARRLAADPRLWTAFAIAALLIAPNMAWNLSNSFATFAHTADNARWGGGLINVGKGLEFMAAQLGVFGPILMAGLVATVFIAWRDGLPDTDRMLLAFTLPVLAVITVQAFLSRAHANWAAVSYVGGTVLVTATLVRLGAVVLLKRSLALHAGVLALLVVGTSCAGLFRLPIVGDPFQRMLGWKEIAAVADRALAAARTPSGTPFRAVMADDRAVTAELLYYMRDKTPVFAWRDGPRPLDHFELTRPLRDPATTPVLLVSTRRDVDRILGRFERVTDLGQTQVPAGLGEPRRVRLYALSGLKAR
jgi:4-amino-4-deoxy-L-arabinose transferase-like glycosyltransferase